MRRAPIALLGVAALAITLGAAPAIAKPPPQAAIVVAQDGSGDVSSLQAAIDTAPASDPASTVTTTILVQRGVYEEVVTIPSNKRHLRILGATGNPRDVVIRYARANGTLKPDGTPYGTSGSAIVTISADDVHMRAITIENSFDEAANPQIKNQQAVALLTKGDRLVFEKMRFLGNQDTLYVNSAEATKVARQYFRHCYVEGDVDFIFGRATAVFDHCEIRSLDRGQANNGYVTAASTWIGNPYGILITASKLISDAPAGTVHLGRPWHPSNDPTAIAQVVVRNSRLDAHLAKPTPWTDMSGFSWREARFCEYRNSGPGALIGPDRAQLTAAEARLLTPEHYLRGSDGWNPTK